MPSQVTPLVINARQLLWSFLGKTRRVRSSPFDYTSRITWPVGSRKTLYQTIVDGCLGRYKCTILVDRKYIRPVGVYFHPSTWTSGRDLRRGIPQGDAIRIPLCLLYQARRRDNSVDDFYKRLPHILARLRADLAELRAVDRRKFLSLSGADFSRRRPFVQLAPNQVCNCPRHGVVLDFFKPPAH